MGLPPAEFKTFQSPRDVLAVDQEQQPRLTGSSSNNIDTPDGRYIAGQEFYNHEMYGSLRTGGAVDFWSMTCLGIVAGTFSSVFSATSLNFVIRPMMQTQLGLTPAQSAAAQRLTKIPVCFSFVFGILSDCYPIMGLRRKGYMMIGIVVTGISLLFMALISTLAGNKDQPVGLVVGATLVASIGAIGNMMSYQSVHTRVIELSQREALGSRGAIVASYLIFRFIVTLISNAVIYGVWGDNSSESTPVPLAEAIIILVVLMVLPLPIVWRYWDEKSYSLSTSVKVRSRIFWKILQQKAVWRVMVFTCFYNLFLGISFSNSAGVVGTWAGASTDNSLLIQAIGSVVTVLTTFVWSHYFMNRSWRMFFGGAPVFVIVPQLIAAILVCLDIVRDRYLYRVLMSLTGISASIQLLASLVPLTEIVIEGSEGVMVGLALSLYFLIQIFVGTNAQGLFQGSNFYNEAAVAADTSDAQIDVLLSLVLNYGLNALAFIGLIFLPSQKLDAQQLRIYGGYTKSASSAFVIFAAALLIYSLLVTILSLIPGTSCLLLAGGSGC